MMGLASNMQVGWVAAVLALSGVAAAGADPPFELVEVPLDDPTLGVSSQEEFLPSRGRVNALVVFAQFADEADPGQSAPDFAPRLFDPQQPGSFTHFYDTMSFGQLAVRGQVLSRRYAADGPARIYQAKQPGERGRYGRFVEEVLSQVDAEADMGQFDNDGPDGVPNSGDDDGAVDYVFVLLRSVPPNFLLKGATGITGLGLEQDYYTQDPSAGGGAIHVSGRFARGTILRQGTFAQTVGSMAHEFGHSLGLPDLYDLVYDGPEDDSGGIGKWGLMGRGALGWNDTDGPAPFCAWSLQQLGWIGVDNQRLVEVRRDTLGLVVADLHHGDGGAVYRIPLRVQNYGGVLYDQEYLLLEHRSRGAHHYNRPLPEGLLVWHMDQQAQYAVKGWMYDNKEEQQKLVDLVCADGLFQDAGFPLGVAPDPHHGRDNLDYWAHDQIYQKARGGNLGDDTDPFEGLRFTRFGPTSNPSSQFGQSLPSASTGLTLSNIRRQDEHMALDIRMPAWAGTIREDVFWVGEVQVDGDLTIAPEGRLYIYTNTLVRFAGSDRLRAGQDPSRCEMTVEGVLRVLPIPSRRYHQGTYQPVERTAVVFEAQQPGDTWWGIAASDSAQVDMPEDMFVMRDQEHAGVLSAADLDSAASGPPTAVVDQGGEGSTLFTLGPNYPNPFSQQTRLRYSLADLAPVQIAVFDALGQQVRALVDEDRPPGEQEVVWDGLDADGRYAGSGLYVAHMEVPGKYAANHKMMRLPGGFSRLSDIDSTLQAHGADWRATGVGTRPPPAPEYGVAGTATPARVAFTLGSLWVRLAVLGQDSDQRQAFQALAERMLGLVRGFDPSPRQGAAVEAFSQSLRSEAARPDRLLAELRPTVEQVVQDGDPAATLYFFLGEWVQTLDAAAAATRALSLTLPALVQPAANAQVSQVFAAQLTDADEPLRVAMQDLTAFLQAEPWSQEEIAAFHDVLGRILGSMALR